MDQFLPPIILGFGGVLPILIRGGPFTFEEKISSLVSVIFVMTIWAAYMLALITTAGLAYSNSLTFACLAAALGLLLVVFLRAKKKELKTWDFFIYLTAIFLISVASANYVAAQDQAVLVIDASKKIKTVKYFPDEGPDAMELKMRGVFRTMVILPKTTFEENKKAIFAIELEDDEKAKEVNVKSIQLDGPVGLGKLYRLKI